VPTLAQAFPTLSNVPPLREWGGWEAPLNLVAGSTLKDLVVAIHMGQSWPGVDLYGWSGAVREEVLAVKRQAVGPADIFACEILLFAVAIAPMRISIMSGELHRTYDWIVQSISDHTVPQDTVGTVSFDLEPARAARLIRSQHPALADELPHSGVHWLHAFYYYERKRNAMPEMGSDLLTIAAPWLAAITESLAVGVEEVPVNAKGSFGEVIDEAVWSTAMVADWAAIHHPGSVWTEGLARTLDLVYSNDAIPDRPRATAGVCLTGPVGQATDVPTSERAAEILDRLGLVLRMHERLQVRVAAWGADVVDHVDELTAEIEAYLMDAAAVTGSQRVALEFGQARLSGIISFPLHHLIKSGQVTEAVAVLQAWYGIRTHTRSSPILLLAPTFGDGPRLATDEALVHVLKDSNEAIRRVAHAGDRFLNTTTTLDFERTPELHAPERRGIPNPAGGEALLDALAEYLGFEALRDNPELQNTSTALIQYPGNGYPVQSSMLHRLGWTHPISSSLQEPAPDRPLERVLVWPAGTFTVDAEVEAVRQVLSHATIVVIPPEERSRDGFLDAYCDPSYDALWVISHGAYDRLAPDAGTLTIRDEPFGEKDAVRLKDLADLDVPGEGRRLLVLNACDGAAAADLGGLNRIGFAPLLARHNQAVVAHLWPVEALAAAAFGATLACRLEEGDSFFEAYSAAVAEMTQGQAAVLDFVSRVLPGSSLEERLRNQLAAPPSLDWWGSPTFLE